jgi:pimeloyl-ACP methyl ester carboxylesterase
MMTQNAITKSSEVKKLYLDDRTLAYCQDGLANPQANPIRPSIVFLPGFFSDMTGSKASFLADKCVASGRYLTRLDYSGHGASSGRFIDGCIGDWLDDALAVVDKVTTGKLVLVGSSMGGWIMLLLALARPDRIAGLIGIAAAPDFTEDLVWEQLSVAEKQEMHEKGAIFEASDYGDPMPYTLKLVEEGRRHLLLRAPIPITCPVRLIQGKMDKDVPWQVAEQCYAQLQSTDKKIIYIDDGEHRLSREQDLDVLWQCVEELA